METEKRKISKRTIIIAAILIILLGLPAIYFLTIRNQEDTRASWYSSSWMYRRAISVSGAGVTRSNEDVLITVDTATLTTAKLQADCDDLRFVDSDDSTALS